jgi:hypothetical protein
VQNEAVVMGSYENRITTVLLLAVFVTGTAAFLTIVGFYHDSGEPVRKGSISGVVVQDSANPTAANLTGDLRDDELLREVVQGAVEEDTYKRSGVPATELDPTAETLSAAPYHEEPVRGHYLRHDGEVVAVSTAVNDTST